MRHIRRVLITAAVSAGLVLGWALPALAVYHHA